MFRTVKSSSIIELRPKINFKTPKIDLGLMHCEGEASRIRDEHFEEFYKNFHFKLMCGVCDRMVNLPKIEIQLHNGKFAPFKPVEKKVRHLEMALLSFIHSMYDTAKVVCPRENEGTFKCTFNRAGANIYGDYTAMYDSGKLVFFRVIQ